MRVANRTGTPVVVRGNDIDTDRIIPARFLKEVTFTKMGEYAFIDEIEKDTDHPFNKRKDASVLIVNKNFGCGSSREHAPQALMRWGIKVIIGESFGEIFAGNCTMLGIPLATMDESRIHDLMDHAEQHPDDPVAFDLEKKTVTVDEEAYAVEMNDSARNALLGGTWDSTSLLLEAEDKIFKTSESIPYMHDFEVIP
ncbi:MAG: 3-isopropylmalate dehydratase small subunit [archaeon]